MYKIHERLNGSNTDDREKIWQMNRVRIYSKLYFL